MKLKRSPEKPDMDTAAVTEDGPGTLTTGIPCSPAAATKLAPGSLTPGVPASVTKATSLSARISNNRGILAAALCSWKLRRRVCMS